MTRSSKLTRKERIGINIINSLGSGLISWFCLHLAIRCLQANPPRFIEFGIWTIMAIALMALTWNKHWE